MTKPAAAFLQLLGVLLMFFGIGVESTSTTWVMEITGFAMLVWGGYGARQNMKKD